MYNRENSSKLKCICSLRIKREIYFSSSWETLRHSNDDESRTIYQWLGILNLKPDLSRLRASQLRMGSHTKGPIITETAIACTVIVSYWLLFSHIYLSSRKMITGYHENNQRFHLPFPVLFSCLLPFDNERTTNPTTLARINSDQVRINLWWHLRLGLLASVAWSCVFRYASRRCIEDGAGPNRWVE